MKKTIIILILIFPLLGSSAKKPIDVSITLPISKASDTRNFAYYQNMYADGWCDFYRNSKTGNYHLYKANISVTIDYGECAQDTFVYIASVSATKHTLSEPKEQKEQTATTMNIGTR